jgi:hypothetical protein
MLNTRRIRLLVSFVIAVVALLVVSIAPSLATTVLTTQVDCYSLGHGRMQCEAQVSGGTGVYVSHTWTPTPFVDGGGNGGQFLMTGFCSPYHYGSASFSVTDSGGASDTGYAGFFCGDAQ